MHRGARPHRPLGASYPRRYEGIFAHEYQHLLESYESPDEFSWVNEGLADYAQTLVGYVDTRLPPTDEEADGHLACFGGYRGGSFGGPENSLTRWQDQGGPEVLCDYGAAYSMMMYLRSRYGAGFLGDLHREDASGFAGLDNVLDDYKSKKSAQQTLHDWAAMTALDAALDKSRGEAPRRQAGRPHRRSWLNSQINWSTPQAYDSPGAPTERIGLRPPPLGLEVDQGQPAEVAAVQGRADARARPGRVDRRRRPAGRDRGR